MKHTAADEAFMRMALDEAGSAIDAGDIPVGAVLIDADGNVVATAHNQREQSHDATAHAEVIAIRAGCAHADSWRLDGYTLYVTLEPCPMCAGAISQSRIGRLVFGAFNDDYGAAGSMWDLLRDARVSHRPEVVSGVLADEASDRLSEFFAARRKDP